MVGWIYLHTIFRYLLENWGEFKMINENDKILEALFNSFYSNRFYLVGHTIRKLIDKGIDCSSIPHTLNGMTIFGFFISTYPTLLTTMEKIDEYDLISRVKMFTLIKKTKPVMCKKWNAKDKNNLNCTAKIYSASVSYREIMRNAKKSSSVCSGVKVRYK